MKTKKLGQALRAAGDRLQHKAALYGGVFVASLGATAMAPVAATAEAATARTTFAHTPGNDIKVGHKMRALAKNSAVKVDWRWDGPDITTPSAWSETCSGTKAALPHSSTRFILTAAHCFGPSNPAINLTGSSNGVFRDAKNPIAKAENFGTLDVRFGIFAPGSRWASPSAGVKANSIATNLTDLAFLAPSLPPPSGNSPSTAAGEAFAHEPAVPLNHVYTTRHKPIVGEQVAFYAMPDNKPGKLVLGRYLLRASLPSAYSLVDGQNTIIEPAGSPARPKELVDCAVFPPHTLTAGSGESGGSALTRTGALGPLSFVYDNGGYNALRHWSHVRFTNADSVACFSVPNAHFVAQEQQGFDVPHQYTS